MPIYEYRCGSCGRSFDQLQRMVDEPLTTDPECGGPVRRVIQPVGIIFKGSGFYATDSRKASSSASPAESGAKSEADSGSKAESKGDSKGEKSESKGEKSESKSDSSSPAATKAASSDSKPAPVSTATATSK